MTAALGGVVRPLLGPEGEGHSCHTCLVPSLPPVGTWDISTITHSNPTFSTKLPLGKCPQATWLIGKPAPISPRNFKANPPMPPNHGTVFDPILSP